MMILGTPVASFRAPRVPTGVSPQTYCASCVLKVGVLTWELLIAPRAQRAGLQVRPDPSATIAQQVGFSLSKFQPQSHVWYAHQVTILICPAKPHALILTGLAPLTARLPNILTLATLILDPLFAKNALQGAIVPVQSHRTIL